MAGGLVAFLVIVIVILVVQTNGRQAELEGAEAACVTEVAEQYESRGEADVLPFISDESRWSGEDEVTATVGAVNDTGANWVCVATRTGDDWSAEATP